MGAPVTLGVGGHPLIARVRQHVVLPQPLQLLILGFNGPPKLSRGGLSCCLRAFADLIKMSVSQQTTAEMD